jgi:hypothetical protein
LISAESILGATTNPTITASTIWLGAKFLFLIFLGLYFIFSLLVVRQINLLNSLLGTNLSNTFRAFAFFHVLLATAVLVFAFIVL